MTRKSKLLAALAAIVLTLLMNVAYLESGSSSMLLMLAVLLALAVTVLGSALYFLYADVK